MNRLIFLLILASISGVLSTSEGSPDILPSSKETDHVPSTPEETVSGVLSTSEETCSDDFCAPPTSQYAHFSFKDYEMPLALFSDQLEEVDGVEIHVKQGKIPSFLHGSLYRVGPGTLSFGNRHVKNLVDGLSKVNKWSFNSQTGSVTFSAKFLKSDIYNRTMAKQEFVAFKHMDQMHPPLTTLEKIQVMLYDSDPDNLNIAVWKLGEAGATTTYERPVYIDVEYSTLDFIRKYIPKSSDDMLLLKEVMSASHFSRHPVTGNSINYKLVIPLDKGIFTGKESPSYNLYEYKSNSEGDVIADLIGSVAVAFNDIRGVHSLGVTPDHIVLPRFSMCTVLKDPISMGKNIQWNAKKPAVFDVISLTDKKHTSFEFSAQEAQHIMNAFERKNSNNELEIVVDFPTRVYPAEFNGSIFEILNIDCLKDPKCEQTFISTSDHRITRFILNMDTGVGTKKALPIMWSPAAGTSVEFPFINPAYSGLPYCYVYFQVWKYDANNAMGLMKVDMCEERSIGWEEKNKFPMEPIFVARPDAATEDDGVVLSPVLDAETNSTSLYIWDAKNLEVLTVLDTPITVPFTIHGIWIDNVGV